MDDADVVRGLKSVGELPQKAIDALQRQGHAGLKPLVEALPADVFHVDEGVAFGQHLGVMDRDDVRMIQLGHRLRFTDEPGPPLRVVGDRRRDGLQGSFHAEHAMLDQIDATQTAGAELVQEHILAEQDRGVGGRGHLGPRAGRALLFPAGVAHAVADAGRVGAFASLGG